MIAKEALQVMEVYRKDLFLADSIRGIMKKAKSKSYGRIFLTVQNLLKEGCLISQKQGKSTVCSLNLSNPKTLLYLSILDWLANEKEIPLQLKNQLEEISRLIPLKFYSVLLTQINSSNEYDLVILVDESIDASRILNILLNNLKLNHPNLHPSVFRVDEFKGMLLQRENNFAKLLIQRHWLAYGSEGYYRILKEAIENGFR